MAASAVLHHRNVLGGPLALCSSQPITGWFRDGFCRTDANDSGRHVIASIVDAKFLAFTRSKGNDLETPRASFPGLRPGDRWCLCALRWKEAFDEGAAPQVDLNATHEAALKYVSLSDLQSRALVEVVPAENTDLR
jgi:uncharacterized protein (DUF2237 family)